MRRTFGRALAATLLVMVLSMADWAAWLGWDQHMDELPDGSVRGPYEAWQVIGLVGVLLVIGVVVARRVSAVAAVLGATLGMTAAAAYDWSDDASGLWVIGAGLVMLGTFVVSLFVAVLARFVRRPAH
ncbi:hypothetical protein [Actinomadura miaoliensis]|uniref:Uncharacterized protein n=1 Tax=Actinomadura miaoliensis TaxID=430685 RepID=A0ABP7X540_9ACTN